MGGYYYPPGKAIVETGNPIGGKFALPPGYLTSVGKWSLTPQIGWPGYYTYTYPSYYNGPGKFGPSHGPTTKTRIVFPTTGGNPYPNYGTGSPTTPTTTFGGNYDFSRVGSINVQPGPRRFGGTLRLFSGPNARLHQYIYHFSPIIYKQYGHTICLDEGMFGCTPSTFVSSAADTTGVWRATRFMLNMKGTGTGARVQSNTAKATTATTATGYGGYPTVNGQGTPSGAPASYITGMQQFLNLIHPWTTGFASVRTRAGSPYLITPQAKGYDINLGGADITVTHYNWYTAWNKTLLTVVTTTVTNKQYLYGVGRIVSMVRPRLIHTYTVSAYSDAPITMTGSAARLWRLKVFFLPEPAGMLLLGAGVAALLGLSRMRRR
jgi:hypothetical protein